MNRTGAIRQAQKMLHSKPSLSRSDVLYLLNRITADSTCEQKEEGAKLLRQNVRLFNSTEFNAIVSEYINRTGFKPKN